MSGEARLVQARPCLAPAARPAQHPQELSRGVWNVVTPSSSSSTFLLHALAGAHRRPALAWHAGRGVQGPGTPARPWEGQGAMEGWRVWDLEECMCGWVQMVSSVYWEGCVWYTE